MRLLIINPNTSPGVTDRIRSAAQSCAAGGDAFVTTCPAFGPELIVNAEDARLATQGVIDTVKNYDKPVDGIILASFGDTGAEAVRALRPKTPVIGIASAAFSAVRALRKPFGIVTFGQGLVPGLEAKTEELGLHSKLVGIAAATDQDFGDPGTVQTRYFKQISALCQKMENEGAQAVILGGGPLAGMTDRLSKVTAIPLVDGTRAAVSMMRAIIEQVATGQS